MDIATFSLSLIDLASTQPGERDAAMRRLLGEIAHPSTAASPIPLWATDPDQPALVTLVTHLPAVCPDNLVQRLRRAIDAALESEPVAQHLSQRLRLAWQCAVNGSAWPHELTEGLARELSDPQFDGPGQAVAMRYVLNAIGTGFPKDEQAYFAMKKQGCFAPQVRLCSQMEQRTPAK